MFPLGKQPNRSQGVGAAPVCLVSLGLGYLLGFALVKRIADGIISDLLVVSFCKLDDSAVARELAITDSEHSDAEVSCTDNGTFNLSRGQTPLTEGSEGENL